MTDHSFPPHSRFSTGSSNSQLAWRAYGLAAAALVAIVAALTLFGVSTAIGGSNATSDNWVGVLVEIALFGGLLASLAGFVLAAAAKVKHEPWLTLWLPLSVFPAVLAFLLLGEAFWWE